MKPADKAKEIEAILDILSQELHYRPRKKSIEEDICVKCGQDAHTFNDELSLCEYGISGLCQDCQDNTFGV